MGIKVDLKNMLSRGVWMFLVLLFVFVSEEWNEWKKKKKKVASRAFLYFFFSFCFIFNINALKAVIPHLNFLHWGHFPA